MKLVSEKAEDDLKKHEASAQFDSALEDLAINMLRVIAGAGKPELILEELHYCVAAATAYREAHNVYPPAHHIASLLSADNYDFERQASWSPENRKRWEADGEVMCVYAARAVRRASLRVVAAQWAGQKTILANAERAFGDAMRLHEQAWEERRRIARQKFTPVQTPPKSKRPAKGRDGS